MTYPEAWDPDVRTVADWLAYDQPLRESATAIFVFGHYLPQVPAHVVELWHQGAAPVILITGYGHDQLPEGMRSEAHYYQTLLVDEGVPVEAIILEEKASNTLENVRFGLQKLAEHGITPGHLVITGVPWLMRRAAATFRHQAPTVKFVCSSFNIPLEIMTEARVARLIGELERLQEYAAKGDIAPTAVPTAVEAAADRLRAKLALQERQKD